ncbi:XkdN-like protein [Paenibacillus polysaccharolyticus]|uniref:phage tail assembly chaperone n=1 Tax=Paenibacillus polysaccharolyticus TaxID=582692 RepID=UPI00203FAB01|nr:XkdN-like protein [Paenibacillus polysaccharolyticus]MCM3131903.1 XkdN-like protein [Paenibacillus polysaccharolyticus]
MSLQEFLNNNPVDNITAEVAVSKRFTDKDGKLMLFKIKPMTEREHNELAKKSTTVKSRGKTEIDTRKFNASVVIDNTIYPNFKDAESIKAMGVTSPEQYLGKVLLSGEVAKLVDEISKLSGFDTSMEDLVEEAKN